MVRDANDRTADEQRVLEIAKGLSTEGRLVLAEVLRLEKEKLHMKNPVGIVDDIISNVKATIK